MLMPGQFTNWKLIPHIFVTICGLSPSSTLSSYAPTLVASYGYDRLKSNAMVSIGAWCLLLTNVTWGFIAYGVRLPSVGLHADYLIATRRSVAVRSCLSAC